MYSKIILLIGLILQISRYTKGSNCEFSEDNISAKFNFNKLSQNGLDNEIKHQITNDTIRLQLCQPLNKSCAGHRSFACLTTRGVEKQFDAQPEIIRDDGRITFRYTGEKCQDNVNRSLNISMICDYTQKNSQPEISFYSQDQCDVLLTWRTVVACPIPDTPEKLLNCTVEDALGNVYNLSSLKKTDNYVVPIGNNATIILNICQPVVYGYQAVCRDDFGACLRKESNSYHPLGYIEGPKFIENHLMVKYEHGIPCPESNSAQHMQTIISFTCNLTAHNTYPEYKGQKDCQYLFDWHTVAACSEKKLSSSATSSAGNCTIRNPLTNTAYDLNSLANKDYNVAKGNDNANRKIRICGPLSTDNCRGDSDAGKTETGVCLMADKIVGGKANLQLHWSHELGVYLNYTDGAMCQKQRRYTIIQFICSRNDLDSLPIVAEDYPCNSTIHFKTSLVCEQEKIQYDSASHPNDIKAKESIRGIRMTTGTMIAIVILPILCGIIITIYLVNSRERRGCRSWWYRGSDIPMQYSRINTGEETDALLDAPETHCQSDSDDDLLSFDSLP